MKQETVAAAVETAVVAPRVGAWIETLAHYCATSSDGVALRTGAWIETHITLNTQITPTRRPPRGGVD